MTDFNLNDSAGDEAPESSSIVSQLHGGAAEGDEFDLTMASAPGKSLPLQAISVGLVLLVGAGSLYLMRRAGTRAGIDFNTNIVVSAVDTTIKKMDNEDEILEKLASTGPPEQVPKEQVPRTPFQLVKDPAQPTGPMTPLDPGAAARERLRVEIVEAFGRLQVESVMHGRIPIAKISGKLYRVDDTLGGKENDLFTIVRIEDRSVYLKAGEKEYVLSMVK